MTPPSASGGDGDQSTNGHDEGWEAIHVRVEAIEPDEVALGAHGHDAARAGVREALAEVIAFPEAEGSPIVEPIVGPGPEVAPASARLPRLARHSLTMSDGHRVAVAVCGHGVPLVIVHGFSAEGMLYAQTLSRLVSMGFKVVAIDVAGHGGTQGLPTGGANMASYANLLGEVLDALGIERAVLAGHSMGGRLVTQLAAMQPKRALAVILIDAIVGDTWDRIVNVARVFPPLLGGVAVGLVIDTMSTVPVFRDPTQAAKLARLVTPTLIGHVRRPWRLLGPAVSILRSRGSRWMLQKLAQERVPVFVIHGDRDVVVPLSTGQSAAQRTNGDLVVVHRASHSWLLKDPEAVPGIMLELMKGRLGTAILRDLARKGLDPADVKLGTEPGERVSEEIEDAFLTGDALVRALTPDQRFHDTADLHRPPRYRWTIERMPHPRD